MEKSGKTDTQGTQTMQHNTCDERIYRNLVYFAFADKNIKKVENIEILSFKFNKP